MVLESNQADPLGCQLYRLAGVRPRLTTHEMVPKVRFELTLMQGLSLQPLPIGLHRHGAPGRTRTRIGEVEAHYRPVGQGEMVRTVGIEPYLSRVEAEGPATRPGTQWRCRLELHQHGYALQACA